MNLTFLYYFTLTTMSVVRRSDRSHKHITSKLYVRSNSMKNFKFSPSLPGFLSGSGFSGSPQRPSKPEILSLGILNFPSLVLSPVTHLCRSYLSPVTGDCTNLNVEAEVNAIAKKVFITSIAGKYSKKGIRAPTFTFVSGDVT